MTSKRNYYDILGVAKSADTGTIKKAYRKLAKKYHPDTNAGNADAKQKFEEVSEAYAVLSDSEKKKCMISLGIQPLKQALVQAALTAKIRMAVISIMEETPILGEAMAGENITLKTEI